MHRHMLQMAAAVEELRLQPLQLQCLPQPQTAVRAAFAASVAKGAAERACQLHKASSLSIAQSAHEGAHASGYSKHILSDKNAGGPSYGKHQCCQNVAKSATAGSFEQAGTACTDSDLGRRAKQLPTLVRSPALLDCTEAGRAVKSRPELVDSTDAANNSGGSERRDEVRKGSMDSDHQVLDGHEFAAVDTSCDLASAFKGLFLPQLPEDPLAN
jgi:hypothetical protein